MGGLGRRTVRRLCGLPGKGLDNCLKAYPIAWGLGVSGDSGLTRRCEWFVCKLM